MKTKAAILWEIGKEWSVEEIELDPPKQGEVLVKMAASGLCHSDEHLVTGDLPFELPIIGGHEGAGVVEEVGPGVSWLQPGDHVVFGFIPSCGRCPSCSTGHQNLCDLGALLGGGLQITDQTSRHHGQGTDLKLMCLLGTFCPPHGRERGQLHQDRARRPSRQGLPAGLRRGDGVGLGGLRRRRAAGRDGGRRGRRRHRRQRHPGRQARRCQAHRRHRPPRGQAREGDGVRRHAHRGIARRGPPAHPGHHVGHHGQQGHHDHGRGQR